MINFPNAKINLGLSVTEKRTDGFHNIETVFVPVGWKDSIEVIENENYDGNPENLFIFSSTGLHVTSRKEDNLIYKAWDLIRKDYSVPPILVHLHKVIPMGAGLGGGSSDAAFFIRLLNDTFELGISWGEMHHYARQIGSDCSFFITNRPAFATGKGDQFETIRLDLSAWKIVIVYPMINSNTREAYEGVVPARPQHSAEEIVLSKPVEEWKDYLFNDFEKSIFKKYPRVEVLKDMMYAEGAAYASMSGSGSAVYGLFKEYPKLNLKEGERIWREKD